MNKSHISRNTRAMLLGGLGTCLFAGPVLAADAAPAAAGAAGELAEVVVTGFRESLRSAIETKRNANDIVDVVKAEDIAKFPDLNLAESLQRIPGVAIDRDGGEGRSITVRGLGPDFTRIRLNGMEALATTGGTDSSGGANRGRGFDFQIFASELFSSLTVRKSASASVEEGSLGATVDLRTGRAFDYSGPVFAVSGQAGYNDLARKSDPRATLMLSNRFLDNKLGALFSVAYSNKTTINEGSSSGRWENGITQSTGLIFRGLTAASPISLNYHPRIPRYGRLVYDQKRLGMTTSLQFQATPSTLLNLDALYAKQDGSRSEQYLEIISFSRGGQGNPQTTIVNPVVAASGDIVSATFNGVDARTENRLDVYTNKFSQLALTLEQEFGDRTKLKVLAGRSRSSSDNPIQTTVTLDRYDSNGYSYDYSQNNRVPGFNYGFDVANPASWQFSASTALGDASLIRMRPNRTDNNFDNVTAELGFRITDAVKLNGGLAWKKYDFVTTEARRSSTTEATTVALPTGTSVAQVSSLLTGFGRGFGIPAGTPTSWVMPSIDAIASLYDINCNCINSFGDFRLSPNFASAPGGNRNIGETDKSAFVQLDFSSHIGDMPLRGNVGVRYVKTAELAQGYIGTTYVAVGQDYSDTLPSGNLTLEFKPNLLARLAAAKVMSRPQLPNLTPGASNFSTQANTLTNGNPLLQPFRAKTADLSFEWYPDKDTLLSVGFFYKDIGTFIQTLVTSIPFGATGLPLTLLPASQTAATVYTVTQPINTSGGPLKGFELSAQRPFNFLPGFWRHLGGIANYTRVSSKIDYVLTTSATAGSTFTSANLINLSPTSWNLVLYWENDKFSTRVTETYRDRYLSQVPAPSGNDVRGKAATHNVDFQATYNFSKQLSVSLQGINLTDQADDRWISSTRDSSESYDHSGRQFYLGVTYRR